jgi:NmrA-like family
VPVPVPVLSFAHDTRLRTHATILTVLRSVVWEPGVGYDNEIAQGKLLVDTAKAAGVKHFVWSTLDSSPYNAVHWESKDRVDQYLKASGVPRTS